MKPGNLYALPVGEITGEKARHPEVAICLLIRACYWYVGVYNQESEPECSMFSAHMLTTRFPAAVVCVFIPLRRKEDTNMQLYTSQVRLRDQGTERDCS